MAKSLWWPRVQIMWQVSIFTMVAVIVLLQLVAVTFVIWTTWW